MAPRLDDAAAFDDVDEIGGDDRRQPVGDDERGPPAHEARERPLDLPLGLGVEGGGGLVEQQDGGVLQHGARDRQALALAARQLDPVAPDPGVVAVGKGHDEVVGPGVARRLDDLILAGLELAVSDVGADGVVEQADFLADQPNTGAQRGQRNFAQVGAVYGNPAAVDVIEPGNQVEDG